MFQYKEASFYSDYFRSCPGIKLTGEFKKSEEKGEENLFIGEIEVLGTIHPLVLRVEIPTSFPHHKLMFRTKSLFGYPHLIPTSGKKELGSWFCLNTPFAETAEEQLEQEVSRLKAWVHRQMREDLPAIIEDPDFIKALAFANAYEWENPDEVREYHRDAFISFLGDYGSNPLNFKEKKGFLYCIKTPDSHFFVINNPDIGRYKLPYLIVDSAIEDEDRLDDFIVLKNKYDWTEGDCKHLLPDFDLSNHWNYASYTFSPKQFSEESALKEIDDIRHELLKDCPILPSRDGFGEKDGMFVKVNQEQKTILLERLGKIEADVKREHGFDFKIILASADLDDDGWDNYYDEVYPLEWHFFALGFKRDNSISWRLFLTWHQCEKYETRGFDIRLLSVQIRRPVSLKIVPLAPQYIYQDSFFGRGSFSTKLQKKRIALVGLGAIGSQVAHSLARSGVTVLGLWDEDTVEPGNLCRSCYHLGDLGESKVGALAKELESINPFIRPHSIVTYGDWVYNDPNNVNFRKYRNGSFYGSVNYNDQEKSIRQISNFDLIIDCTGSNELLHFLSYAVHDVPLISMCITNHANELLCLTNRDGNVFELRKAYLSRIEQDTKNFFVEDSGCYSPTFLATYSDIASLINVAMREFNKEMDNDRLMHSIIVSHDENGVLVDRLQSYVLEGYDIRLSIPNEVELDAEEMEEATDGTIGFVFGSYSRDGKQIMVTHIVEANKAEESLLDAFNTSKGIIDYIGDYMYSGEEENSIPGSALGILSAKAADSSINTRNPLLSTKNPGGTLSFFLFINDELVPFKKVGS